MSYTIIFRPEVRADLLDAFQWYQNKQAGLGHSFRESVEAALLKLSGHPRLYPAVHQQVRRVFIRHFPFGIFYIIDNKTVIILAVMHARRDPQNWKSRI